MHPVSIVSGISDLRTEITRVRRQLGQSLADTSRNVLASRALKNGLFLYHMRKRRILIKASGMISMVIDVRLGFIQLNNF